LKINILRSLKGVCRSPIANFVFCSTTKSQEKIRLRSELNQSYPTIGATMVSVYFDKIHGQSTIHIKP
jgi:hypothetical protein